MILQLSTPYTDDEPSISPPQNFHVWSGIAMLSMLTMAIIL